MSADSEQIQPATHEVRGTLAFNQHDDAPYWSTRKLVEAAQGGGSFDVEVDGEPLTVSLGYKGSGVAPRPDDRVSEIKEFKVYWHTEDGRKFGGHVKPIFEKGTFRQADDSKPWERLDPISVPESLGDAVGFQIVAGTYADPGYYRQRLPQVMLALADELGVAWNPEYFTGEPHEYSTLTTVARTLRVERQTSKKLVRRDGILSRLFYLVADEVGTRVKYEAWNKDVVGYRHSLDVYDSGTEDLLPRSAPGFSLKVYHPQNVRSSADSDDPLFHPRVEVAFRKSLNSSGGVAFADRRDLLDRLDMILLNVLTWGDVSIKPGSPPFVPDDYYDVEPRDRPVPLFDDPTPRIKREQDAALIRTFATLTGDDVDRLRTLVADGGEPKHYEDVADELDVATSTVYRFLKRCGGLLESDDGVLRFISERQRERALEMLEPLEAQVDATAAALAKTLDMSPRFVRQKGSAFQQWLSEYAAEFVEADDGSVKKIQIGRALANLRSAARLSDFEFVGDVVAEGFEAWRDAGLDPLEFRQAVVEWSRNGNRHRSRVGRILDERGEPAR